MSGDEKKPAPVLVLPQPERQMVTAELPWAPGRTVTGPADAVARYLETVQRQRIAATAWPAGSDAKMTALAELFPCFRRGSGDRLPGIDPWHPAALVDALNSTGVANSVRHAALFLLSIWNGEDWSDRAFVDPALKLRRRRRGEGPRRIGRWDLHDAWANWDEHHRAAALAWFLNPFWP